MQNFRYFFIGALGACAFEALRTWELRGKIRESKFKKTIKSPMFWSIFGIMVAASGFLTWAYHSRTANAANAWDLVLTGIAVRSMIRETTAAGVANSGPTLGESDDEVTVRDVLL